MQNNEQPWARISPASPANVLREIGATFDKSKKTELAKLAAEDRQLQSDFDRLCSSAALEANRKCEYDLHADLSITAENAAKKIRELRIFREEAPDIAAKIQRHRAEILKQYFPTCADLCAKLIEAIDEQLVTLPKVDIAARWSIPLDGDFWNSIRYPLLRLRSMVEYDLPIFKRLATQDSSNFEAPFLLEAAGLLGPGPATGNGAPR